MKIINNVIYQKFWYESVLIKDDSQQLHPAVMEVERKLERKSDTQLVGTIYINSVILYDVVYKRRNEQFFSRNGLEVRLISKL
ncbi:hypothetical protein GCM10025882_31980 [Acinetobacter gyllenbergii]|uniref:Uncharacterized protein n=1 Tax=Acinetobacter gyllenbergii CIP 110306 = MTCC 11365 TaxID=1217657 RepID=A0A829HEE1_9GAMM|nr:hypothetical protein [Acinetobacter gyllenbergii]EPF72572.1 hypothetical protein F957_03708 [Acinetobacter gyllenbergii CIP 110306 = MTCC 11365]GMA12773.1 hypothetical protein GCM10025882_31980 [Acinetobacter gyllenbergii]